MKETKGRKTVTRRVVKPQPKDTDDCRHEMQTYDQMLPEFYKGDYSCVCRKCRWGTQSNGESIFQPPYRPGDILYVRETWQHGFGGTYLYKADAGHDLFMTAEGELVSDIPWHPSIHMPREAARIFLRVTDVRVEKVQDISDEEAEKEGCNDYTSTACGFADVWDRTLKPKDRALYGWEANPWVWVIEFERCEKPKMIGGT